MRTLTTCLLVIFLGHSIQSQSNADLGVAAIGLVVTDIEASKKFYVDILEMVEVGGFSLDEEWSKDAGAASDQPFSVIQLKLKDTVTATVLKLAYFNKTERKPESSGINLISGVNYITLFYSDQGFHDVMVNLDKAGIEKIGWVKTVAVTVSFNLRCITEKG